MNSKPGISEPCTSTFISDIMIYLCMPSIPYLLVTMVKVLFSLQAFSGFHHLATLTTPLPQLHETIRPPELHSPTKSAHPYHSRTSQLRLALQHSLVVRAAHAHLPRFVYDIPPNVRQRLACRHHLALHAILTGWDGSQICRC